MWIAIKLVVTYSDNDTTKLVTIKIIVLLAPDLIKYIYF